MYHDSNRFAISVITPLAQSLLCGLFVGVATGALASAAQSDYAKQYALFFAALACLCSWFMLINEWRLIRRIESGAQDYILPAQAYEPDLEPVSAPVRIELKQERQTQFIDLPVSELQLIRLANSVLDGAPLSESALCGAGALFSKREWHALRDELLRRNMLQWQNERSPSCGLALTRAGAATMRYFASMAGDYNVQE